MGSTVGKVVDSERRRRLVQEAKAASALNRPNIVTVHDAGQAEGLTFIAMEYVRAKRWPRVMLVENFR